ncbi:MAG: hypothetical protein KDB62_07535 [Solirubrobacterales bacterium]|nr:hypothetical protein [Solirubrobacterales bacterium]
MPGSGTDKRLRLALPVAAVAAAVALMLPSPATALTAPVVTGPVVDPIPTEGSIKRVVPLARKELRKRVSERNGNNVPRYRNGKGRIAPYSIRDQWCVAFSTWIWGRAGFDSYLGTRYLRQSYDRSLVAIQVTDLSRWARRNGYWSYRARPGYLVAYGGSHIGIVIKADRRGRAVRSIEGNKGDRVRRVTVDMEDVTGYISPVPLKPSQVISPYSALADVE